MQEIYDPRRVRTRAISSSTFGRMPVDDRIDARGIRMHAVAQGKLRIARRRHRGRTDRTPHRISSRVRRIDRVEVADIIRRPYWAPRACRTASTAMLRAFSFARMSSSALPRDLGIDAAQHVVGAEFDDDRVGAVGDRPVEPRQSARGGVARDAGILDLDIVTPGLQRAFELRRKGVLRRQAVAGGERIAERHNLQRRIGPRGCGKAAPPSSAPMQAGQRQAPDLVSAIWTNAFIAPYDPKHDYRRRTRNLPYRPANQRFQCRNKFRCSNKTLHRPRGRAVRGQSVARQRRGARPYPQGHRPRLSAAARRSAWSAPRARANRRC